MDIRASELRKAILQVSKPLNKQKLDEYTRLHLVPLSGFAKGLIPMFILLCQRIVGVLAFVFLPINQAVSVACLLLIIHVYLSRVPDGDPGIVAARPLTQQQSRINEMIHRYSGYEQPIWCIDNHWSTIVPLLLFTHPPKHLYRRHLVAHDGATLGLDWYVPNSSEEIRGIMLVIPGLNGSSQGGYVVDLLERLGDCGFASAVLNGRGAGRSQLDSVENAFHLGRSGDLMDSLEAIETILRSCSHGKIPIYIVGYSAGGIRAMKFAAVYGERLRGRVSGIVSFGASVRNQSTLNLRSSTLVYQPVITHTYASTMFMKILEVNEKSQFTGIESLFTSRGFDSFRDFDRRVTSVLHKMSLEEYERNVFVYHDDRWRDISVPLLVVNAIDDPILHIEDAVVPEMALGNSNIIFMKTKKGGHIGWPTGLSLKNDGYRWMSDVTLSFISTL
jgi:predicted alpha/beta-fold hydrolase